jgi:ribose transport system substrate-binding protein
LRASSSLFDEEAGLKITGTPRGRTGNAHRLVLVLAGTALLAAACSDGKTPAATTPSGSSSANAAVAAAEAAVQKAQVLPTSILVTGAFTPSAGKTIYNIACNQELVGCSVIAKQIETAAKAIGYTYKLCDAGKTPQQATGCFNQAVNAKADAIVTNAVGTNVAGNGYAAAKTANIPIVAIFSGNTAGADGVVAEVGDTGCAGQGQIVADLVIANTQGRANALFVTERSIGCDILRTEGFTAEMKKCDTCKTDNLEFEQTTMQANLPRQVLAAIQGKPDLNYIVGVFGAATQIAATAAQQSGRQSISVAGLDSDPAILTLLKQKQTVTGAVAFGRAEAAWTAVDAAARVLSGQTVQKSLPVPILLINQTNIDQVPAAGFAGAAGYDTQFKALWGK